MPHTQTSSALAVGWIYSLARPYLRGYRAVAERGDKLRGYWFFAPRRGAGSASRFVPSLLSPAAGFFVGYLLRADEYVFLAAKPPECLVFAFVQPVGGGLHRRLVGQPESLLRKSAEYIRWLTHRPPRFAFYPNQLPALVRHDSMREWPPAKYEHYSRNFFIETLAWLVRSALVRKLCAAPQPNSQTTRTLPGSARRSK